MCIEERPLSNNLLKDHINFRLGIFFFKEDAEIFWRLLLNYFSLLFSTLEKQGLIQFSQFLLRRFIDIIYMSYFRVSSGFGDIVVVKISLMNTSYHWISFRNSIHVDSVFHVYFQSIVCIELRIKNFCVEKRLKS